MPTKLGVVAIALLLIVGLTATLALPISDQALKIAVALVDMGAGATIGIVWTLIRDSHSP